MVTTLNKPVAKNRIFSNTVHSHTNTNGEINTLFWHSELCGEFSLNDRKALDNIRIEGSDIFIIKNGQFLFSKETDHIPIDEISCGTFNDIDALVSHNYRNSNGRSFTILTHPINSNGNNKIILGTMIPNDTPIPETTEKEFISLAHSFKSQFLSIQKDIVYIEDILDSDDAVLVINRGSGNIIAVNNKTVALLNHFLPELLDTNFFELQPKLTELLPNHSLKIANIRSSEEDLSVVTFTDAKVDTKETVDPNLIITEQLTNHLSNVTLAYSDLMDHFSPEDKTENEELIESTLNELNKINHFIKLYNMLNRIDDIPFEEQFVVTQLEFAVDSILNKQNITNIECIDSVTYNAPKQSLAALFEALLSALSSVKNDNSKISINCTSDTNCTIQFSVNHTQIGKIKMYKDHTSLIKTLTSKIGISMTEEINNKEHTVDIELTINKQDK